MNITVKAHKLDHKESIKEYAEKKLEKLSRFFDHIQEITIDLDISKTSNEDDQQCASATLHVSGTVCVIPAWFACLWQGLPCNICRYLCHSHLVCMFRARRARQLLSLFTRLD